MYYNNVNYQSMNRQANFLSLAITVSNTSDYLVNDQRQCCILRYTVSLQLRVAISMVTQTSESLWLTQ